jgi:FtsH-binding integral membrane protein
MSLYGYTTRRDLSSMGSFLIMGVWGLVVASLVNLFMQSSAMQIMISMIAVLVFTGLTAYDTQSIKESYLESDSLDTAGKKAIFGALMLYINFISLFIHLLQLFGERK